MSAWLFLMYSSSLLQNCQDLFAARVFKMITDNVPLALVMGRCRREKECFPATIRLSAMQALYFGRAVFDNVRKDAALIDRFSLSKVLKDRKPFVGCRTDGLWRRRAKESKSDEKINGYGHGVKCDRRVLTELSLSLGSFTNVPTNAFQMRCTFRPAFNSL
jgi:hypothetical protein